MSRPLNPVIIGLLSALGLAASVSAAAAQSTVTVYEPYYGAPYYYMPYGTTYHGYIPPGTAVYYGSPYYYDPARTPVYYHGPRYYDRAYGAPAGTTVFFGTEHQLPAPYYQREAIEGAPE